MTQFDIVERCRLFAVSVRRVCVNQLHNYPIRSDISQLSRSSASIGANLSEALEKLGKKDSLYRIKVALKETYEVVYWLRIINDVLESNDEILKLLNEANQLKAILITIKNKFK